ncbi:hypothetical protein OAC75_01315 [Pseudomonadales bacterium]|nr:hypothetical protein [Pseudomonadales bacterium]
MATFVNFLRLTELATGEGSGSWGTTTNQSLELIGEALGYATQQVFGSDADATTTIADGASDPARAMYFKITSAGSLTATRTCTIAPNTVSRVMFIENATTGSQSIAISQGSGANVTIATGKTAVVYLDGAGSGAAVVDAMAGVDPGVTDTLAEVLTAGNTTTTDQKIQFRDTGIYINSSADGQLDIVADTEIQIAATTVDVNGNLDVSGTTVSAGKITADAGIDIDNINIDGTTLALSSGDLTLDVAGDIIFDADGDDFIFAAAGTNIGKITNSSSDFLIRSLVQDKDIIFKGDDSGSVITALTLDMSAAGAATFNSSITLANTLSISSASTSGFLQASSNVLQFGTSSDDPIDFYANNTLRMSLNTDGKLLIGDSASHTSDLLQIETPASGGGHGIQIRRNDSNTSQGIGHILFGNNTDTDLAKLAAGTDGANDAGYLILATQPTGGSLTDRLKIGSTGSVVFNESGADADFRVESDSNANAIFMDASTSYVGINRTPSVELDVQRISTSYPLRISASDGSARTMVFADSAGSPSRVNWLVGAQYNTDNGWELTPSTANGGYTFTNRVLTAYANGNLTVNENGIDADFRVESDSNANMLFVDGGANRVGVGTGSPATSLSIETSGTQNTVSPIVTGQTSGVTYGGLYTVRDGAGDQRGLALQVYTANVGLNEVIRIASDGAATFNSTIAATSATFTTADNLPQLQLISTDADNNIGPVLDLWRNSGSPADGDDIGRIYFYGENDASQKIEYVMMRSSISDVTDGTEDSQFQIYTYVAGSQSDRLHMNPNETIFNESSRNVDFRVESDGNTNMLMVDGELNSVGIGTNGGTTGSLVVQSNSGAGGISIIGRSNGGIGGITLYDDDGSTSVGYIQGRADDAQMRFWGTQSNGSLSFATNNTERMRISADGEVTQPYQPAFSVTVNAAQNNIATNTDVVVVWGAETFDVGSNFSASEFRAPVTGKYQLNLLLRLNNIDTAADYYIISFFSSNRNYRFIYDPGGFSGDPNYWATSLSVLADMDANDTVYITINQSGGSAQTDVDVGNTYSRFSGYLVA